MLPVLVPSLGENWSLILCPLFFGVGKFLNFDVSSIMSNEMLLSKCPSI